MTMTDFVEIEKPQFAIGIEPDADGKPSFISLVVTTSGSECRYYLCQPEDTDQTARVFTRELTRAGATARREKHGGLIVPGGGSNGAKGR